MTSLRVTWQPWTVGFLGLWFILTPFIAMDRSDSLINSLTIGLVGGIAGWLARKERPLQGWCALLAAVWITGGTMLPGIWSGATLQWSSVLSGLVLAIAGFTLLAGGRQSHHNTSG